MARRCGSNFLILAISMIMMMLGGELLVDAEDIEVLVNNNVIEKQVFPTVLGGNEVLNSAEELWEVYDVFIRSGLRKMSWRIHANDDAYGWRWDDNSIDKRADQYTWCKLGLGGCFHSFVAPDGYYANDYDFVDSANGNQFVVDAYSTPTDLSHSGKIVKTAAGMDIRYLL